MLLKTLAGLRQIHLTKQIFAVDASPLAVLRRKTGYTLNNCRKALEIHENDSMKAEEWLHSQAKAHGWAKVTRLQNRDTAQGLIGLICNNNVAAMVEVNCETDFVARNENFRSLVASASLSTFEYANSKAVTGNGFSKIILSRMDVQNLKSPSNPQQTLADLIALCVGRVSENICLKRAICISVSEPLLLSAYSHPPETNIDGVSMGRFGGIVVYKKVAGTQPEPPPASGGEEVKPLPTLEEIGKQLSVHIVGMNPTMIGSEVEEESKEKVDKDSMLIYQECISDPQIRMGEYLDECGIKVIDFVRFQCGEENLKSAASTK